MRHSHTYYAIALGFLIIIILLAQTQFDTYAKKTSKAKAVPLIKLDTGSEALNTQIQTFYDCFLKFSHPDPSGSQVLACYQMVFGSDLIHHIGKHHFIISHANQGGAASASAGPGGAAAAAGGSAAASSSNSGGSNEINPGGATGSSSSASANGRTITVINERGFGY